MQPGLNRARCHERRRLVTKPDPDAPGQFQDGASVGSAASPRAHLQGALGRGLPSRGRGCHDDRHSDFGAQC